MYKRFAIPVHGDFTLRLFYQLGIRLNEEQSGIAATILAARLKGLRVGVEWAVMEMQTQGPERFARLSPELLKASNIIS